MSRPVIAVTAGDPAGIGPEVILKALADSRLCRRARFIVIGDGAVFRPAARRLRRAFPSAAYGFIDCGGPAVTPGRASARTGAASLGYLEQAMRLRRRMRWEALVTAPVTKWAIQRTRPSFAGHTEWLARQTRTRQVVMMFASEDLRVVVLTRHIPLARVSSALTPRLLASGVRITAAALRAQFGIRHPRLALMGLNPHAGEGQAGTVEQSVMLPVLRRLRRQGLRCEGPFAADGFFGQPVAQDAVLCAYHDQGLIPFKMAARDRGCQVTLGLPFVRTSPDHGSALDIAGRGAADAGSMRYALHLAVALAGRTR